MRRLVVILSLLIILGCQPLERPLKPLRPTVTPGGVLLPDPRVLSFAEIAAAPQQYVNQPIRITGAFTPLEVVECSIFKGPSIHWGMVAENLQMNATGFEAVVQIVPDGTEFTVDGIWRLYNGPAGCGKEPPTTAVWYVEITQILKPNPITQFGTVAESAENNTALDPLAEGGNGDTAAPAAGGSSDGGQALVDTDSSYPIQPQQNNNANASGGNTVVNPVPTSVAPLAPPTPTPSSTPTPRVTSAPAVATTAPTATTPPTATSQPTATTPPTATSQPTATTASTATATAEATATATEESSAEETTTPASTTTLTTTATVAATTTTTVVATVEITGTVTATTTVETTLTTEAAETLTAEAAEMTPTTTATPTSTPTGSAYPINSATPAPTTEPTAYP